MSHFNNPPPPEGWGGGPWPCGEPIAGRHITLGHTVSMCKVMYQGPRGPPNGPKATSNLPHLLCYFLGGCV